MIEKFITSDNKTFVTQDNLIFGVIENKKEENTMANNFKFKLLYGTNPKAQYDAITTKDAYTFYLLQNGIGYLGTQLLFDATNSQDINIITDMLGESFVANDTDVVSTKAIVDYVTSKVSDLNVLSSNFFNKVESHTWTTEDASNDKITAPQDVEVGEVGLLFTADDQDESTDKTYYFISLKNYLSSVYTFSDTNSIKITTGENNEITADLNIKSGEQSLKADENGVYIEKTTVINDGDGTEEGGEAPSDNKLVTESAFVNYVKNSLNSVVETAVKDALDKAGIVTYEVDDGNVTE